MRFHSESECFIFVKYDSEGTPLAPRKSDKWEAGLDQFKEVRLEPLTGIVYLHYR